MFLQINTISLPFAAIVGVVPADVRGFKDMPTVIHTVVCKKTAKRLFFPLRLSHFNSVSPSFDTSRMLEVMTQELKEAMVRAADEKGHVISLDNEKADPATPARRLSFDLSVEKNHHDYLMMSVEDMVRRSGLRYPDYMNMISGNSKGATIRLTTPNEIGLRLEQVGGDIPETVLGTVQFLGTEYYVSVDMDLYLHPPTGRYLRMGNEHLLRLINSIGEDEIQAELIGRISLSFPWLLKSNDEMNGLVIFNGKDILAGRSAKIDAATAAEIPALPDDELVQRYVDRRQRALVQDPDAQQ